MPLSSSRLATNIVTALKTLNPEIGGANETQLLNLWTKIATEIVTEVKLATITTSGSVLTGNGAGGTTSGTGVVS